MWAERSRGDVRRAGSLLSTPAKCLSLCQGPALFRPQKPPSCLPGVWGCRAGLHRRESSSPLTSSVRRDQEGQATGTVLGWRKGSRSQAPSFHTLADGVLRWLLLLLRIMVSLNDGIILCHFPTNNHHLAIQRRGLNSSVSLGGGGFILRTLATPPGPSGKRHSCVCELWPGEQVWSPRALLSGGRLTSPCERARHRGKQTPGLRKIVFPIST